MVQRYPIEDNFLSAQGYLTLPCWMVANAKNNPLAARAVFDSLGQRAVAPDIAEQKLQQYRQDISKLNTNLVGNKALILAAVALLLFLLGLADVASATYAYRGYFHEWPGGSNFPWSMFSEPNGSILYIPQYFDASL